MAQSPLVFTDLDGTLLDHFDYSFTPAKPVLAQLDQWEIPVIPNTSKTCAELLQLRQTLSLDGPFIVENGAAIYVPVDYFPTQPSQTSRVDSFWVHVMGGDRNQWTQLLGRVRPEFDGLFTGLSEMTLAQLMDLTGLDQGSASLAAQRQYGEPIVWHGDQTEKAAFTARLTELGGQVLEGGRFIHLSGYSDKGLALQWLQREYAKYKQDSVYSIALGDGNNDVAMLEAADRAVIVRSPVHKPPKINNKTKPYVTQANGPAGWAEALTNLLSGYLELNRHG